ncbi:hypothetical protein EDC01DRAFT_776327 [Geopyxis carbonaria]|nr:hypothetical protein EDC01DRAFT_776327 [Geopyxis carbonaria]
MLHLPREIILMISEYLYTFRDFDSLCRTTRATYSLLQPALIRKAAVATLDATLRGRNKDFPANTVLRWAAFHSRRTLALELTLQINHLKRHRNRRHRKRSAFSAALFAAVVAPVADHAIIELLLENGADQTREWGDFYITPLLLAVELARHSVVELLLRQPRVAMAEMKISPLHLAVWRDDTMMVRTIVKAASGSVGWRMRDGMHPYGLVEGVTAVEMAVWFGRKGALLALVEAGVLPKPRDARILIHAAAGGIDLAELQVARYIGATIDSTAAHPQNPSSTRATPPSNPPSSRCRRGAEPHHHRTAARPDMLRAPRRPRPVDTCGLQRFRCLCSGDLAQRCSAESTHPAQAVRYFTRGNTPARSCRGKSRSQ